ncbi:SDR family NAD(P)-dependent oxidoreductase [Bacillus atrophaeus]|uniref:SDR family NAD(P)-dependent oxidoreductase n=1 Tax=Bacillus atrophaeus TaxID=1452 RepID=UPI002280A469|nr:SDR family NAD(P)-dependent oxidoreductase [Bacillus atrophaeus]MCY8910326.1 SDR family NAD(P)-dependent oxidoreductase [Bacillus atrophaeus]MEC0835919.1 SDR family NAD(P)-dependent oxidoreductase [Bacillus atrophaeus]MEC0847031.1 SDR family NAD(P)-dependent oxidoreductase [Bacillus atrophaeus]MEC0848346.1 SDR family NAD(P)-dependent oxidoreductase [Bacillus atrophaeus]MEC0864805.1 SDR family NAD(P)-dependent oxidoreductase [Bacillus atrophaeus]
MAENVQRKIILCEADIGITPEKIETLILGSSCRILRSEVKDLGTRYEQYAKKLFVEVKSILQSKPKGNVLLQIVVFTNKDKELFRGLGGLLKTAQLENPRFMYQIIQLSDEKEIDNIVEKLQANSQHVKDREIRYENGVRYIRSLEETEFQDGRSKEVEIPWKEGGIYLITGGAGGLGFILAEEIAKTVKDVTLTLTGRSELNMQKQAQLKALQEMGANVEYRRVNIVEKEQVKNLITSIRETFGGLHGIIHSAGVIRDNYIIHKTEEEFAEVMKPKVTGLLNIDEFTRDLTLDFIMLFSSQAGETGNPGQADYAVANAFMDVYAGYRNKLVEKGVRWGKTLSINWPLWENGGMHVDKEIEKIMFENMGILPMRTETGIDSLYKALAQQNDQVMIMEGDINKLRGVFVEKESNIQITEQDEIKVNYEIKKPTLSQEILKEKAETYFKKLLSYVIKLPINRIEADAPMEKYGVDSLMIMSMTDELEKFFGSLSKTLFFEYQNIQSLTAYFLESHRDELIELLGMEKKEDKPVVKLNNQTMKKEPGKPLGLKSKRSRFTTPVISKLETQIKEDIAIIGVSGRYPQSKNLDEFWENLCGSKDCITEIPKDRWDHKLYYREEKYKTGKKYSKWGGFIDDVDKFDPLFFNITPREAEFMDPQERLFLESVLETIEDAGYTRESLSKYQGDGLEGNVGVYVGAMYDEYQLYGAQEQIQGRMLSLNGIMSSIANRVSHFFNFHGPSIGLNTMCSSSLIAIHLACQSIHQGECELAIAGGVNVSIHPNKYILLGRGNFLSSKGRCESFGKDGDGYVPGEGVGSILLKPLSKAIEDRDQIYGVIKGSAINHGGKTNGYTVPNPNAQASMIRKAIKEARVDARNISYIEAHGTGTALGDPIEITALTKAFADHTDEKQFCVIGSVKSNIGHLESAAGIVGVTKVLLQMKYGKIVPSLHSKTLNPNIDFEKTPFKVQQDLEEWKRPVIEKDGVKKEYPRIAGISAFGAGGSNAHLLIEEYIPEKEDQHSAINVSLDNPAAIILSGKNEEKLKERAEQLLIELEKEKFEERDLPDIAYTLQVGREAMESRLGMIVSSTKNLKDKLREFLAGKEDIEDLYIGRVNNENNTLTVLNADEDLQSAIDSWINKRKYGKLLDFWVKGLVFNWERLYTEAKPKKISLPTYPFTKERYWIPKVEKTVNFPILKENETRKSPEVNEVEITKRRSLAQDNLSTQQGNRNIRDSLKYQTLNYFKKLLSSITNIPVRQIESDVPLETYGIDSIMIKQLSGELEKTFGFLSPTIFFEYKDINSLARYLVGKYQDKLIELFHLDEKETDEMEGTEDLSVLKSSEEPTLMPKLHPAYFSKVEFDSTLVRDSKNDDIAIIGISGRYPHAKNINEFWENLKAGKDCVDEIPKSRWDYMSYYDKDKFKSGKINSKWGGFIDDFDKFDPLFFNISPEEAEFMDPQERIFLETVYETIEDAGYTREKLSKYKNLGLEGNIGVFVGVTFSDYQLYGIQSQMRGRPVAVSGITSSIANRVSYFCNFHGPSMAIDSMCSSSLTALHVACDSIKQGGCKLAVVGGVNLSLHPNKYLFLSQYNFLSSKGRCKSFGDDGDGYVPGEGVGSILLKPLAQAEADGDQIYGVIKSTAINHGGKTNGYSVPNPSSQTNVIDRALIEANINPRSISYIEAHGTGTSLGDPIEIAGLTNSFSEYTNETGFCSIGSAKSNIGHLEAAAGIAGITKVLLQIKHKQLVPSLHAKVLNTSIDFNQTPFKVQQKLDEWKQPILEIEGEKRKFPRIAGISSFGAGGSNGHVIIEEYIPREEKPQPITQTTLSQELIVLSAKNEDRLKKVVKRLMDTLNCQSFEEKDLANIAYTLQIGREAMEDRLGIIVTSIDDLIEKLAGFLKEKTDIVELYRSSGKKQKNMLSFLKSHEEIEEVITKWIEMKKYSALLELWVAGFDVDWERMHTHSQPQRISLPTYPFERERYWLPELEAEVLEENVGRLKDNSYLHPLVHRNTSNLKGQRFTSTFTGNESFLKDNVIMGERILPGTAYLEMIRGALDESVPKENERTVILKNILWSRPIGVNGKSQDVHIGVYPEANGGIGYEIYSEESNSGEEIVVYCQGQAEVIATGKMEPEYFDLPTLQAECTDKVFSGNEECNEKFGTLGIESIYVGEEKLLAKINLPKSVTEEKYSLHPSVLDSAIQASIALTDNRTIGNKENSILNFPIVLEELKVIAPCRENMWAVVRKNVSMESDENQNKLDIDLLDENGEIHVRVKGLHLEDLKAESQDKEEMDAIMLHPVWKEANTIQVEKVSDYVQHEIILCEANEGISVENIETQLKGASCHILKSRETDLVTRYEQYGKELFVKVKRILQSKPKGNVLLQIVVFTNEDKELFRGLGGLLKTAQLENPRFLYQIIQLSDENEIESIVEKLQANCYNIKDKEIRYENSIRYIRTLEETKMLSDRSKEEKIPWKEGGIYLITGGAGGLGFIFAEEIARKVKDVTLILTGRSELNMHKQAQLKALQEMGANVEYMRSDIVEKEQVKELISGIRETFGSLHGIIHSAGVIQDNVIIHKTEAEFAEVMKPKVSGLLHIDEFTRDLALDFIILFSSGAGEFGNPGQADYAAANAFLDVYAEYRNRLVEKGVREGKTLTINWPLWKNGGMHVDKEIEKIMFENLGMIPMKTDTGINAFYKALAQQNNQVMIMEGDIAKIKKSILLPQSKEELNPLKENTEEVDLEIVKEKVIQNLAVLFGESMKLSIEKIDTEETFQSYGVDSIKLTSLNQKIATHFQEVSNTIFFEYSNLSDLGEYLISEYPHDCLKWVGNEKEKESHPIKSSGSNSTSMFPKLLSKKNLSESIKWKKKSGGNNNKDNEPIAVIGVSGRFPMAKNLDEFWQNLKIGKDCITEIPKDRWSLNGFYYSNREEAIAEGKSFNKWGGFLEGFSQFDPLFFNISPAEAERIDPQERLFLEECWKAVEDAGYVPSEIEENLRKYIGVFGGITKTGFNLWNNSTNKFYNTSFSSLVNRVSYFMDFRGPSVAVDTMCSSSLVALHRACESIRHGEINMAVVGAANLYLHPSNYLTLTQAGLLSDSSRSSVFGKDGNGFIPSEGVGAVVLKRLSDAEKDNDHIWAVIKGSAVTHSGKTNGYNIPDPAKQADVIQEALNVSNVDPRSIRHLEVAASGSEMVDSIEMTAISKVFNKFRDQDGKFYTMSSIKSVLGHGEAVAGMAQFIKALLQLKHKVLCPTLLPEKLNPNIRFSSLRFKINTNLVDWSQMDIDGIRSPRRIGINNFGAGGVYAHLILEEYDMPEYSSVATPANDTPHLFVFSAKTNHSLRRYLDIWKDYLGKHPDLDVSQLAYILHIKREAMKKRFASVARNTQELINNIEDYLKDNPNENVYSENANNSEKKIQHSIYEQQVDKLMSENNLSELAEMWVNGSSIKWTNLYKNYVFKNIPQLPTYPFRQKDFWVNGNEDNQMDNLQSEDFISLDSILGTQLEDTKQDSLPVTDVTETDIGFIPLLSYSHTEDENNKPLNSGNLSELPETIEIQQVIKDILYEILYLDDLDEFDIHANFREIGLDSISISNFIQKANRKLGINLKETDMFDYPNTVQFANYIASQLVKLS